MVTVSDIGRFCIIQVEVIVFFSLSNKLVQDVRVVPDLHTSVPQQCNAAICLHIQHILLHYILTGNKQIKLQIMAEQYKQFLVTKNICIRMSEPAVPTLQHTEKALIGLLLLAHAPIPEACKAVINSLYSFR